MVVSHCIVHTCYSCVLNCPCFLFTLVHDLSNAHRADYGEMFCVLYCCMVGSEWCAMLGDRRTVNLPPCRKQDCSN